MRIVFIRHAEPDYSIDSLTEKGWREAKLLAKRVSRWDVDRFYCSPLGRAKDTASCTLKLMNREATTYQFLREFDGHVVNPYTGTSYICWDLMPDYWTKNDMMYDRDNWSLDEIMRGGVNDINAEHVMVRDGIDGILKEYGYTRHDRYYVTDEWEGIDSSSIGEANRLAGVIPKRSITDADKPSAEPTIVIFCHLGVTMVMLSHLLGISAPALWHGFFLPPTSVTILNTEERVKGMAYFRVQVMGDVSHLHMGGEPISGSGYYVLPMQEYPDNNEIKDI